MQLLPILQQAFSKNVVVGFENIHTVIQANAEGHLVKLKLLIEEEDGTRNSTVAVHSTQPLLLPSAATTTTSAFVKHVDVQQYANTKSWPDLRRTLMYLRTEVRMYREVMPQLKETVASSDNDQSRIGAVGGGAFPHLFDAKYNLDGLLTDEEAATDPAGPEPTDLLSSIIDGNNDNGYGGYIVMEAISPDDYYQDSPISLDEAKQTLSAAAALHASAWQNEKLLSMAQNRLSRGSYHLLTRNPKELQGMPQAWDHFKAQFGTAAYDNGKYVELFERCGEMGRRIQSLAEYICTKTSPASSDLYATLCHGDFKAMNCFLPKKQQKESSRSESSSNSNNNDRGVIVVDFASTGVGLGMSDVAMHIHHAVRPELLSNGGEEMLIDHYLTRLNERLKQQQLGPYPRDVALQHYRLAVADYFRFFLGRFWKSATRETFIQKKDSKNTALINRDVDAAMAFLERVEKYVTMIEVECTSTS